MAILLNLNLVKKIQSHGDATGVFSQCIPGNSGNRVRHIVSSQDDAVAGVTDR